MRLSVKKAAVVLILCSVFLTGCDEEVFRWYEAYNTGVNLFEEKKFKDAIDEFSLVMYSRIGEKNNGIDKDIDRIVRTHSAAGASWIYYRPNLYIGVSYYMLAMLEKEKKENSNYGDMEENFLNAHEFLKNSIKDAPTAAESKYVPDGNYYIKKLEEEMENMKNAKIYFEEGVKLYQNKEYLKALVELEKVSSLFPSYPELKRYLSGIELAKEIENKIKTITQKPVAVKPDPKNTTQPDPPKQVKEEMVRKEILSTLEVQYADLEQLLEGKEYNKVVSLGDVLMQKDFISDSYYKDIKSRIGSVIDKAKEKIGEINSQVQGYIQEASKTSDLVEKVKKLSAALTLDPYSQEAKKNMTEIKNRVSSKVNELYFKGAEFYSEDKLEQAISVWKQVLDLDPSHSRTKSALSKAENKLKILKGIK